MALYEVYVDGAARGQGAGTNRGHGACGVLIYKNKKLIGQYARGLGRVTSSQAEYEAILNGLMLCWAADLEDPVIYSDSATVVKQVNSDWKCTNEDLLPLLYSIHEIRDVYRFRLQKVKRHVVAEADALANRMLDQMLVPTEDTPTQDLPSSPKLAGAGRRRGRSRSG